MIKKLFDRSLKCAQRNRIAQLKDYENYKYIKDEVGYNLIERVYDIKRNFPKILNLGSDLGSFGQHLTSETTQHLVLVDSSKMMLELTELPKEEENIKIEKICADEESFYDEMMKFDLIVSSLSMHWMNDVEKCLSNLYKMLKDDSPLIVSLFGGDNLFELRVSLQLAEMELRNGISNHLIPTINAENIGHILVKNSFELLTIDSYDLQIGYPSIRALLVDLQRMGESSCLVDRPLHLRRDVIDLAEKIYREKFPGERDKSIVATYEILNFIGWKKVTVEAIPPSKPEMSFKDLHKLKK
ncbi:hypothetical protein SNEBB_001466 [Seison nebaliae]|nr:hypothetical protein SNEBB_001466 [Seison nebaliae]